MTGPDDDFIRGIAARLAGASLPGGCDHCDAEQKLTEQFPGVFLLAISHDDWCPVLRRHRKSRS